jgi:hypothetical protein
MSSYSLPRRYQSYLGANFFQRQIRNVADALPGVIKRGLAETPKAPPPGSAGLPDIQAPPSRLPLYIGLGVGAAVLLAVLGGGRKSAPASA